MLVKIHNDDYLNSDYIVRLYLVQNINRTIVRANMIDGKIVDVYEFDAEDKASRAIERLAKDANHDRLILDRNKV